MPEIKQPYTEEELDKAAVGGALIMDTLFPGWASKIDSLDDRFDMTNATCCVGGYAMGHWLSFMKFMDEYTERPEGKRLGLDAAWPITYAFALHPSKCKTVKEREEFIRRWNWAWRKEIIARSPVDR